MYDCILISGVTVYICSNVYYGVLLIKLLEPPLVFTYDATSPFWKAATLLIREIKFPCAIQYT